MWDDYLQETGSTAAPSSAFTLVSGGRARQTGDQSESSTRCLTAHSVPLSNQRAPHGFQVNHRLEAVDRRNPMLIRVATVTDTEDYRVKVRHASCYLCDVIRGGP